MQRQFLLLVFLLSCYISSHASSKHETDEAYLSAWNGRLDHYHELIGTDSNTFQTEYDKAVSRSISRRQFIYELPIRLKQINRYHILKGQFDVLEQFIRMMRDKPEKPAIEEWLEQMVISTLAEADNAYFSTEHFISAMEQKIGSDPGWISELESIPALTGTATGKLEELQTLFTEATAYLSDTGQTVHPGNQGELMDMIRRSLVGLNNMDYLRWIMLTLNRPNVCFYLQGIRTCHK